MAFPWGVRFEPVQPVACIVELAGSRSAKGPRGRFLADEGTDRDLYVADRRLRSAPSAWSSLRRSRTPSRRHPVTTAAAIATLAELVPGRGAARPRRLRQSRAAPLGLVPEGPYTALRDTFQATAPCSGAARSAPPGCPGRRSRC